MTPSMDLFGEKHRGRKKHKVKNWNRKEINSDVTLCNKKKNFSNRLALLASVFLQHKKVLLHFLIWFFFVDNWNESSLPPKGEKRSDDGKTCTVLHYLSLTPRSEAETNCLTSAFNFNSAQDINIPCESNNFTLETNEFS